MAVNEKLSTLKITDLNDFCLIQIFKYLDMRNLLNIAVSNPQLIDAAWMEFIRHNPRVGDSSHRPLYIDRFHLRVPAVQFLLAFGSKLNKIIIDYSLISYDHERIGIAEVLSSRCSENLKEITFKYYRYNPRIGCPFPISTIKNPFENVERICFDNCFVGPFNIRNIFPNLRILKMQSTFALPRDYLEIPQLEYLEFEEFDQTSNIIFARNLLKENRQLKGLQFHCSNWRRSQLEFTFVHFTFLQIVKKSLLQLTHLDISNLTTGAMPGGLFGKTISFESVTSLILKDDLNGTYPLHFPYLRELKLQFFIGDRNYWLKFLLQLQHLEKLELKSPWYSNTSRLNENFELLINQMDSLPKLAIIEISDFPIPFDLIMKLVRCPLKSLEQLIIECDLKEEDRKTLPLVLEVDWNWKIERKGDLKKMLRIEKF